MAIKMEEPFFSRDDLLQEALVYLWKEETQRRCVRNYLQNQINRGRSVDSRKHRAELIAFSTNHDFTDEWLNSLQSEENIMSEVGFRDLLSAMSERLGKIDRTILYGLAEGRRFREIAKSLQITHVSVFKHRRKIASIAVDLGLEPPPPGLKASLKKDVIEPTSNSRSV